MVAGFRFGRELHVRKEWEFRRIYRSGGRAQGSFLSVVVCRNRLGHSRLGLSVSRKTGGAVRRNRIKRMTREAYRLTRWEIETRAGPVDIVVIPHADPRHFPLDELMRELPLLVEKAIGRARPARRRNNGPRRDRRR